MYDCGMEDTDWSVVRQGRWAMWVWKERSTDCPTFYICLYISFLKRVRVFFFYRINSSNKSGKTEKDNKNKVSFCSWNWIGENNMAVIWRYAGLPIVTVGCFGLLWMHNTVHNRYCQAKPRHPSYVYWNRQRCHQSQFNLTSPLQRACIFSKTCISMAQEPMQMERCPVDDCNLQSAYI